MVEKNLSCECLANVSQLSPLGNDLNLSLRQKFNNINVRFIDNSSLLINYCDNSVMKILIIDLNSVSITGYTDILTVDKVLSADIVDSSELKYTYVSAKRKYLYCIFDHFVQLYDTQLKQIVFQYQIDANITFCELSNDLLLVGQNSGEALIFGCYRNKFPVLRFLIDFKNDNEIIDIKAHVNDSDCRIIVIQKNWKPVVFDGITGRKICTIDDCPKLYRPSFGAFANNYYYLSQCDQSQKYNSILKFKPKVAVYEMKNNDIIERIGQLEFFDITGIITSMIAHNNQLFVHLHRGYHWQVIVINKLTIESRTYCQFKQIIVVNPHLIIGLNEYFGLRLQFIEKEKRDQ